jgi:(p)ppGpp synthase/HD superfamily hydrolase
MHEFAEFGVAAPWRYKKIASFEISDKVKNKTNANVHDFNLGVEKIFVYTPNGDVVVLDKNSCVLDFAYAIHTEIGNHAVRALVNNQLAPLDQKLEDYDVIEIFTDKNKKPARDWLEFVFSKKSIDKIKQTLGIATKFRREQKIHDKKISELLQKTSVANVVILFQMMN